ncbi:hypothetical protein ACZ91_69510 [Streptomyces regensis]|nr:hypothetical protein ACZ91_69510 [Streptomyces regensis]KOG60166.1 hypothetical protein ADK77_36650 [Streptomyces antibioticus]KOV76120.1 hypothetical protein ADL02_32120 [Streptomyces sp. NRRL WC-3723]
MRCLVSFLLIFPTASVDMPTRLAMSAPVARNGSIPSGETPIHQRTRNFWLGVKAFDSVMASTLALSTWVCLPEKAYGA